MSSHDDQGYNDVTASSSGRSTGHGDTILFLKNSGSHVLPLRTTWVQRLNVLTYAVVILEY